MEENLSTVGGRIPGLNFGDGSSRLAFITSSNVDLCTSLAEMRGIPETDTSSTGQE